VALAALAALGGALLAIPADIRVKASGELLPAVRREVFAPRDGVVVAVHVDHGAPVAKGAPLLEIRATDLSLELQKVSGELATTRKQLAAAAAERLQARPTDPEQRLRLRRLTAEEAQFQQQVESLELRLAMLQRQQADLIVRSPIAGDVTTWNARQRLAARPLRRGDALLTVADPRGPWQLELRVPGRRAGRLLATPPETIEKLPVSFALATDPGRTLRGRVARIAQRLEVDEAGESFLLVTVALPTAAARDLVPGAAAVAHITCGRGSLGEAWFHEALDAARLWLPL
jgi:multidrug efflux pump subunit AcrA (membrane-fusion protein)